jgi:hypothetical protein
MHGDNYRHRLLKERGVDAINGRTRDGKKAKAWRAYALEKKGGKSCPIDVREKIEAGTFSLWRALCLRSYIVADARKRGTPINKRYARLPMINDQYDAAMSQWERINNELELDKGKTMEQTRKEMLARQNARQKKENSACAVAIVADGKPAPGIGTV